MRVRRWLTAAALGCGVAVVAYWRRTLTVDGAIAAALVGCVVFARGSWPAARALLTFFWSSSALSRVGQAHKQGQPLAQAKGARRDVWQVLANGGVATVSIGLGGARIGSSAFVGALACANADTWATELGLLAAAQPRLITTGRAVEAGTSGAVTPEGLLASLGGALTVGLAWAGPRGNWRDILIAAAAGTGGCLVDSWLGATLQAAYGCQTCGRVVEEPVHATCGQPTTLVHGWRWMTNDAVNAISTLAGAAIGVIARTRPGVGDQ